MTILSSRDIASLGMGWIWGHQAFTPISEVAPVAARKAGAPFSQDVLLATNLNHFGWTGSYHDKTQTVPSYIAGTTTATIYTDNTSKQPSIQNRQLTPSGEAVFIQEEGETYSWANNPQSLGWMNSLWQLQNSGQQGKGPNLKVSGQYGSTTGCYFDVNIACTTGLNVTPGNPGKRNFTIRQPIAPTDLYFTNNIDTSNIQVTPASNLAISTGEPTSIRPVQTASSSDSEGLNTLFQFLPGNNVESFQISTSISNTVSSSNTQGTTNNNSSTSSTGNSNSDSGSNTLTTTLSDSLTEKVGLEDIGELSDTFKTSLTSSYTNSWNNIQTVDFGSTKSVGTSNSETNGKQKTKTFSFKTTLNLSNIEPTGTNSSGEKTYNYSTPVPNPISGQSKITDFDFIPGEWYEWQLQYGTGIISNTVSGNYSLSSNGSVGNLSNSTPNSSAVSVPIGTAYWAASQVNNSPRIFNASSTKDLNQYITGYSDLSGQFKPSSLEDAHNIKQVHIQGLTTVTTNNNYGIEIHLAHTPTSSSSHPENTAKPRYAERSNKFIDLQDDAKRYPRGTKTRITFKGFRSSDRIKDSTGQDVIHTRGGDDLVKLRGHAAHPDSHGDIVHLGKGDDRLNARQAKGVHNTWGGAGNDTIVDGEGHHRADLGDGNDTYIFGGGHDFVSLGRGHDEIRIAANSNDAPSTLVVHDFQVSQDFITGATPNRLRWNNKRHRFEAKMQNEQTLILHTFSQPQEHLSMDFWTGLGLQNADLLKITHTVEMLDWKRARRRYMNHGFHQSDMKYISWDDFSVSPRRIRSAVKDLHERTPLVSNATDLRALKSHAINLASESNGYTHFLLGINNYLDASVNPVQ